jgi:hypothetical protein
MTELEINGKKYAIDGDIQLEAHSPFFDNAEKVLSDGRAINPQGSNSFGVAKNDDGLFANEFNRIDLMQSKHYQHKLSKVKLLADGIKVDEGNLYVNRIKKNVNNRSGQFQMTLLSGERDDFMEAIDGKTLKDLPLGGPIEIAQDGLTGNIGSWGFIVTPPAPRVPSSSFLGGDVQFQVESGTMPVPSPLIYDDVFADQGSIAHAQTARWASLAVKDNHPYLTFPTLVFYTGETDEDGNEVYFIANQWDSAAATVEFKTYSADVITTSKGNYTRYTALNNPLIPMYYYHQVLRECFSTFGYELQNDWLLEDATFLKKVVVNSFSIQKPVMFYATNIHDAGVDDTILYYEDTTTIIPANHMPEISIADFLAEVMLKFSIYFDVVGKKVFIRHNDTSVVEREVKNYNPNIDIEIVNDPGMVLQYSFDNQAHDSIDKSKIKLSTITDEANTPMDGYFLDKATNFIYKKTADGNIFMFSNYIAYNSGENKSYSLQLAPVNSKAMVLGKDASGFLTGFVPYVYGNVSRYTPTYYNYTFDIVDELISTPGLGTSYIVTHYYRFAEVETSTEEIGDELKMAGIFHGILETLDLVGTGKEYPYMSSHNYQPGAIPEKIGEWNLSLIGPESLTTFFWKDFVHVLNARRKFTIEAFEPITNAIKHVWQRSIIVRGTRLYVAKFQRSLKNKDKTVYECYEIRN